MLSASRLRATRILPRQGSHLRLSVLQSGHGCGLHRHWPLLQVPVPEASTSVVCSAITRSSGKCHRRASLAMRPARCSWSRFSTTLDLCEILSTTSAAPLCASGGDAPKGRIVPRSFRHKADATGEANALAVLRISRLLMQRREDHTFCRSLLSPVACTLGLPSVQATRCVTASLAGTPFSSAIRSGIARVLGASRGR